MLNNFTIEQFANAAIVIVVVDILEFDIIIPKLVFDYSYDPEVKQGYYMYQNPSGTVITLNMNYINYLKDLDDMKTVIVYGFIHEIVHMYQKMSSLYFRNSVYYTMIEDGADYYTIDFIRQYKSLIESRLHFKINDVFIKGIERQLKVKSEVNFDNSNYIIRTLVGAISGKMNVNYDYLYGIIDDHSSNAICVIFPDNRNFYIDKEYGNSTELELLINLIYLTDFKFIRTISEASRIILKLY